MSEHVEIPETTQVPAAHHELQATVPHYKPKKKCENVSISINVFFQIAFYPDGAWIASSVRFTPAWPILAKIKASWSIRTQVTESQGSKFCRRQPPSTVLCLPRVAIS
jgi:hypothetical protein